MRRHTQTLYPHAEHDGDDLDQDLDWNAPSMPFPQPMSSSSTPVNGGRPKFRQKRTSPVQPTVGFSSHSYSQFLKRYRSNEPDDPRNDPDSHYFQRGLGDLRETGDASDHEEEDIPLAAGQQGLADISELLEADIQSEKDKERLVWRAYLVSVLSGDILKAEAERINVVMSSTDAERNNLNIWLGVRSKFHSTSEQIEKKKVDERRVRLVDSVIEDVIAFQVNDAAEVSPVEQVSALLERLDIAQSLYPTLKAFYLDKPKATESAFMSRRDALNSWHTVFTSLRHQISILQRWTGSETLDVTHANTSGDQPLSKGSNGEVIEGTSFVERVLKEEPMQRMFEKGSLVTTHAYIGAARDAQVNLAPEFKEMNLPTFENELTPLIVFPTRLAQAGLRVRLDYVQKLKDPEVLIIDQMMDDLKISIGLACTLKRQYEAFLAPDPGGRWNVPQCISEDYDATILEGVKHFFRLLHLKLKSGSKDVSFKETEVLEAQWATLIDVSITISSGSSLIAEQLWWVFCTSGILSLIHPDVVPSPIV